MVGFGLEYACAHIIILAEISSENLLPIRADFVTERDKPSSFRGRFAATPRQWTAGVLRMSLLITHYVITDLIL